MICPKAWLIFNKTGKTLWRHTVFLYAFNESKTWMSVSPSLRRRFRSRLRTHILNDLISSDDTRYHKEVCTASHCYLMQPESHHQISILKTILHVFSYACLLTSFTPRKHGVSSPILKTVNVALTFHLLSSVRERLYVIY